MKKFSGPISRRYGTALYETFVQIDKKEPGIFAKITAQIQSLSSLLNKDIIKQVANPILSQNEKEALIDIFLKKISQKEEVHPFLKSFFKVVVLNNRFEHISSILNFFLNKSDEFSQIVRARLVSAQPLQNTEQADFENILKSALKKNIVLSSEVDPSLISGYVLRVNNLSIDSSLSHRLNQLSSFLK
jgi:F-type H+-transporting ATPase subunit delta